MLMECVFFVKQKTAYEMRISDWSSDVCSSDLGARRIRGPVSRGVPPGEVVTVMGPSGCGKSSLLAAICGTLDAALSSSGRVLLNGEDIADRPPEARHDRKSVV